ncbi:membrane bound O-acyl transferase family-domain-containing protein [Hypoxylon rubiginosum]|uniref:Membrane bound O-acyl transferase family-domain-containing protein n=1 Tax=Hypoxylon rubiginosum TaxID=110542 RepID=A0ACC0CVX4_9PEZI|nr:membrane bound O-acyl transferase family-domain-containing protein [Hypoxylon rubiginosum]
MDRIKMLALCFLPVVNLLLSFLSCHWAIHTSNRLHRALFFAPFLCFAIFSFIESKHLYFFPALMSLWYQSVALNIVHIASILLVEKCPEPLQGQKSSPWSTSLRSTYRLWSNPRLLPETTTFPTNNKDDSEVREITMFLLRRLSKLALYYFFNTYVIPLFLAQTIGELYPEDVNPAALSAPFLNITARELVVRAWFAIYWIWESVAFLDGANAILASFAVLTGMDKPADWPPLFGHPLEVCGLQNFWSGFWHQLSSRPFKSLAQVVIKTIASTGVDLPLPVSRALLAFIVFLISGLSHTVVSWHLGVRDTLDLQWFLLNFAGCMVERSILSTVRYLAKQVGYTRELSVVERSWLGWMIGYIWLFAFFFWSVPLWKYPRLYEQLMIREWMLIFSRLKLGD